jgi:hypothetical protein
MKNAAALAFPEGFVGAVAVIVCWLLVLPAGLYAQCTPGLQGNNAIYNTTCSGGNPGIQGSPAFIDATVFNGGTNGNICAILNFVLANIDHPPKYPSGAVIDARGLNTTSTSMSCVDSPWGSSSNYINVPSTILLPAGVILIPKTWTLPDGTKVIGEGVGGFEGSSNPLASTTTMRGLAVRTDTRARSFPFQTAAAPSQNS